LRNEGARSEGGLSSVGDQDLAVQLLWSTSSAERQGEDQFLPEQLQHASNACCSVEGQAIQNWAADPDGTRAER
jgi:hypothetical protein